MKKNNRQALRNHDRVKINKRKPSHPIIYRMLRWGTLLISFFTSGNQSAALAQQNDNINALPRNISGEARYGGYDKSGVDPPNNLPIKIKTSNDINYLLKVAGAATDGGYYTVAIYTYNKIIMLSPNNSIAYGNLAWAKITAGMTDYMDIATDIEKAISLNNKNPILYNTKGVLDLLTENLAQAQVDFSYAIALDKNFSLAYLNRAYTKYTMEDYQGALADYDMAILLNPRASPRTYNNRAMTQYALGNYQAALRDINQAIALDGRFGQAYSNRAIIKEMLNIDNKKDIARAQAFDMEDNE